LWYWTKLCAVIRAQLMTGIDDEKRRAAEAALEYLPFSGRVGLGTGSTAKHFIDLVGELVRSGREFRAVATSEQSRLQAAGLGIELLADEGPWELDLCVDGADEVDPDLNLIKGGGAAHTREKIVNRAARLNVIVVDESKLSPKLGTRFAVPIEVLPFGHGATRELLRHFGEARQRCTREGAPVRTDSGNFIYDLSTGPIAHPAELERDLGTLPGVVESGLFIGRADIVLVAGPGGVTKLKRVSPE
jgi:ribose 5-phosphate isomerase A